MFPFSFKNIYTPLTYTAVSVPQILTDQSIINDSLNGKTSVYSVLKKGGFETNWIGNQSLEKSYKEIVYTNDSVVIIDKFHSVLSFNKQRDLEILKVLKSYKAQSKKSIYTLHMIGSHWYYNSRVDESFKKFKPIVESKFTGSSTNEQIINSYDNTILYLDNFLNELIDFIKSSGKISILIFLSDHGENLGEDGKFFHKYPRSVGSEVSVNRIRHNLTKILKNSHFLSSIIKTMCGKCGKVFSTVK